MTFNYKPEYNESEQEDWSKSETILVVDMDEVLFDIASACEQKGILATNKTNEAQSTFKNRTEMKNFLNGLDVPEGFYDVIDTQVAEPAKNAFSTIKSKLYNLKAKFKTDKMELYVSGTGNFRNDLALPIKYKSGRKDTLRPLLLAECKEYIVKYHKAIVVDGVEVDDIVAQRMYDGFKSGQKIIGVSSDKDQAGQGYGWIYNPEKMDDAQNVSGLGELYIDDKDKLRGWGRKFLYLQFGMIGDSVDSYCPRDILVQLNGKKPTFGPKSAYKLLADCKTDAECLTACRDQYIKWYGTKKFKYTCWQGIEHEVNYLDVMQLYLDCARMRRWENDLVNIRDMFTRLKVETLLDDSTIKS
jgi:hypothetical protein